jgi:ATP-dependent DNA helicase PIF1
VPDRGKVAQFAFDASTWTTSVEYTIGLHHVFRQKDPGKFKLLHIAQEGSVWC